MSLSSFVLGAVNLMVQLYADYYQERDLLNTLKELEQDYGLPRIRTWDFIIVGGGSAGCLVASILSERFTVLLLEKGGNPVPATYNGRMTAESYSNPLINDIYRTLPQNNVFEVTGGVGEIQMGKMLGGCGSHNVNIFNRGCPLDYNNWANLTGDSSWNYFNMIQFYKEFENFGGVLLNESQRTEYYDNKGPFKVVTDVPGYLPLWLIAGREVGYPTADPNSYQIPSFCPMERSVRNGIKESSYTAFVKRLESQRESLTIHRYSTALEILLNDEKVAYGVAYTRHGFPQIAHASKEVILSAGPFGSPSLLIKSGIGPRDILDDAGIPVINELPGVGKNLQDHLLVVIPFTVKNEKLGRKFGIRSYSQWEFERELKRFQEPLRTGYFAGNLGPSAQAFLISSRAKASDQWYWADVSIGIADHFVDQPDAPILNLYVSQGRSRSKGELWFNTSAYRQGERDDMLLIRPDFKYLMSPGDLDVFVEAVGFGVGMLQNTLAFRPLDLVLNVTSPGCSCSIGSKAFWSSFIMRNGRTDGQRTGTCKMGTEADASAVVDSEFRVRGIKQLRVIDSSIFPVVPNSNLNAPTLAMAQKAATQILLSYIHA